MRALGQKSKGLCIFMKSLNLWDLALDKKEKEKPKTLASCADGNEKFPHYRTTLSRTVGKNSEQKKVIHFSFYLIYQLYLYQ